MKTPIPKRFATIGASLFIIAWSAIGFDENRYREDEARVKAIASNPEAIGDNDLHFLMSHLYYPDSITAITKAQTPAANAALWRLALEGGGGSQTAAYALKKRMTNKLDNVKLLASKSPEVQTIALRGMLGTYGTDSVELDRAVWGVLKDVLDSNNLEHRRLVTRVIAKSRGTEVTMEEKVKALAASMLTTLTVPDATNTFWRVDWAWRYSCPLGEDVLVAHVDAMRGIMRGEGGSTGRELLATLTPPDRGVVRDAMMLSRFVPGDETLRSEVHRIATNCPSGPLRLTALGCLFQNVTEADRACLERVAATDPLEGTPGKDYELITGDRRFEGVVHRNKVKIFPARIRATMYLRELDAQKNSRP